MKKYQILFMVILGCINLGTSQINIGGLSGSSWTFGGGSMTFTEDKLNNPANFGPGGIVVHDVNISTITSPITMAALCDYDIFFIGYFSDGTFVNEELATLYQWVSQGGVMLITADDSGFDQVAEYFGHPTDLYGTNTNLVEPSQLAHPLFDGPFGTITEYYSQGSLGAFSSSTGANVLAKATNNNITLLEKNIGAGKVIISGDVCTFGNATLTSGPAITNFNDIFTGNLFSHLIDLKLGLTIVDNDNDNFTTVCDCNDNNNVINPGATEICDGADNDCDGLIDEGLADFDSDGHSAIGACAGTLDDCDDANPNTYPGATEICDGLDNDCDGNVPANEIDNDGDTYSTCEGDCDDTNDDINPAATEILGNNIDDNCDGLIDIIPYCTPVLQSYCYSGIGNVTLETINHNSTCDGYLNTGLTTNIASGNNYTISLSAYANGGYFSVYLDFNTDGDFNDAGEIIINNTYINVGTPAAFNVDIPANMSNGIRKMRVMSDYYQIYDPCIVYYGDVEDYSLNITCAGSDTDGDGFFGLCDCDDNNVAVNPSENEILGNNIDDNCDGLVDIFPYCIPSASGYACQYMYISNVQTSGGVTNFNNTSLCANNSYENFSQTHSVSQVAGAQIDMSFTSEVYGMNYAVWVDFDANGSFSELEKIINFQNNSGSLTIITGFTIPLSVQAGTYRMRIGGDYYGDLIPSDPCGILQYGEWEDYSLTVINNSTCPSFTSAPQNVSIVNSSCDINCTPSGGSIVAPSNPCPSGSTLEYSIDNGINWSTTIPTYNQSGPSESIVTRCICDIDNSMFSSSSTAIVTTPATCILITCYADNDNDTYGDVNNTQSFCNTCGTGYVSNADDCNDYLNSINTQSVIYSHDGLCYPTLEDAIDATGNNPVKEVMIHAAVSPNEINTIPQGVTVRVLSGTWTNQMMLKNNGTILLESGTNFINYTNGVYKGKGVFNGDFQNNGGTVSPGE